METHSNVTGEQVNHSPAINPQLHKLDVFLGEWKGRGLSQGRKGGASMATTTHESYSWLEGGFFLQHKWDWDISGTKFSGLEIIGFDSEHQHFYTQQFDNAGHHVGYTVVESNGIWVYSGESQRAKFIFAKDGRSSTIHWEESGDGFHWHPLCDMQWTKLTH